MIKKSTALVFAIVSALIGSYIGAATKENFNSSLVLGLIPIFNALLIISTVNSK